jgi:hypothetical protein
MPVTVDVREDCRILRFTIIDPWSLAELQAAAQRTYACRARTRVKMHVLVDIRGAHKLPRGILRTRFGFLHDPTKDGNIVFFGAGRLVRTFADIAVSLSRGDRARFLATEEQALDYLNHVMAGEPDPPTEKG